MPGSQDVKDDALPAFMLKDESAHDDWTTQERAALRQLVRARLASQTPVNDHIFNEDQIEALKQVADFWTTFKHVGIIMAGVRSGLTLVAFFTMFYLFLKGEFPNIGVLLK